MNKSSSSSSSSNSFTSFFTKNSSFNDHHVINYSKQDHEEEEEINSSSSSSNSNSSSFFTCEICMEYVPLNQKFENKKKKKGCSHSFCADCIAKYIESKVEDNNESEIKCPDMYCDMVLDALSCRSILSPRVFDRWCEVLCESAVLLALAEGSSGSSRRRAYCPSSDCSELILDECSDVGVTRSKCPNCKKLFCFQCQVPWKASHRCVSVAAVEEAITVNGDRNDILFLETVKRNKWKRCPTCYHYIERSRGCPSIICRCKTRFCYDCGRKLSPFGSCVCAEEIMGGALFCILVSTIAVLVGYYMICLLVMWGLR